MQQQVDITTLDQLHASAALIAHTLMQGAPSVIKVMGEMGAGKTTLIQSVCRHLKVIGHTSSPTFSIVNEYATTEGKIIYHFDCYRIQKLQEFYDMGYEEYFYDNAWCFVEWPEKVEGLLPSHCIALTITKSTTQRLLTIAY